MKFLTLSLAAFLACTAAAQADPAKTPDLSRLNADALRTIATQLYATIDDLNQQTQVLTEKIKSLETELQISQRANEQLSANLEAINAERTSTPQPIIEEKPIEEEFADSELEEDFEAEPSNTVHFEGIEIIITRASWTDDEAWVAKQSHLLIDIEVVNHNPDPAQSPHIFIEDAHGLIHKIEPPNAFFSGRSYAPSKSLASGDSQQFNLLADIAMQQGYKLRLQQSETPYEGPAAISAAIDDVFESDDAPSNPPQEHARTTMP